jgi:RNA polymerase sigma-70 factor (ECF subfamily)
MKKSMQGYTGNEDHTLFILLRKRDKEAFSMIYRKYHRYLYALAMKYLKNTHLAEDAVQHVFVKLWESTHDIHIEVNLKNYLYTMTKNYILNYIRDNKVTVTLSYEQAQFDLPEEEDILKAMEDKQAHELLYRGIDQLPPQKKEVCRRKLETDDSNQQIAEKMGISVYTVKSHYQESIKLLRSYFQKVKMMLL